MPCTVDIKNKRLYIKFYSIPPNMFYEKLEQVKLLYNRRFIKDEKAWEASIVEDNITLLKEYGFEFINEAKKLLGEDYFKLPERYLPEIDKNLLDNRLYPFQFEGVRFLKGRDGIGGIFDEMGLGKSCQALMYLKLYPELRPALIVCPCSLKLNWEKEIRIWLDNKKEKVELLYKKEYYEVNSDSTIFIMNYDILGKTEIIKKVINGKEKKKKVLSENSWFYYLRDTEIKIIIADECQALSNPKTWKTKAFIKLKRKVKRFIPLSGTPIKNRPAEFFTVLNLLEPRVFPNRWNYLQRFCNPSFNGFGYNFKGISNGDELYKLIYPLMIRRKKKEVLKELPDKTIIIVPLECNKIELEKYYKAYEKIFEKKLKSKIDIQNNIELLKQLAYTAKRDFVIEWINNFLESDEKLVLFATHIKVLDDLQDNFKNISVRISGNVKVEDRQKAVDDFQNNDKVKLFLGQIRAAGEGITLTASSNVVFVELDWNPATHNQASDRIHRISQKADAVFIYYLIANGTIENDIIDILQEKNKMLSKILDGKEEDFIDTDIYNDLIKKIGIGENK